jgi:hypothetical protein
MRKCDLLEYGCEINQEAGWCQMVSSFLLRKGASQVVQIYECVADSPDSRPMQNDPLHIASGQPTIYPLPSISVTRAHTSVEKASMLIALMVRKE